MSTDSDLLQMKEKWFNLETVIDERRRSIKPSNPSSSRRNVLVTSALPYVNNVPHLGNIIGSVLSADFYARYCRLIGCNTLFICGTDEYGTATETKALMEGSTPLEVCSKFFKIHERIYKWFGISFDYFGRTSDKEHIETCQEIYSHVNENGFTFKQTVEQLFCERCNRFLADRFIEGACPFCAYEDARGDQCDQCGRLTNPIDLKDPKCKICSQKPIVKSSEHIFLDLPKLAPFLKEWIDEVSINWSFNAENIAKAWLKEGLKPRCITRDLRWGVPVPKEANKVFYVWFDAPLGYISLTRIYSSDWKNWWMPQDYEVELVQFMAKDNVPFHAIMFPAILKASNQPFIRPKLIFSTEYLNFENKKFSKSRSIGIFGDEIMDLPISRDVWRYYLASTRPETQDSNIMWTDFVVRSNSELVNNLGNFCMRSLKFIQNNFDSMIDEMELEGNDFPFLVSVNKELREFHKNIQTGLLRKGLKSIFTISKLGNQYLQNEKPWDLVRLAETKERAGSIVSICANVVALLGMMLQVYMPDTAENLLKNQLSLQVKQALQIPEFIHPIMKPGYKIGTPQPLFHKIQDSLILKMREKFGNSEGDVL